jgi:hypothetical protein
MIIKKYFFLLFLIFGHAFCMQTHNASLGSISPEDMSSQDESCQYALHNDLVFDATTYIEKNLPKLGWYETRRKLHEKLYKSNIMFLSFNRPGDVFEKYRFKIRNKSKKEQAAIKRIHALVSELKLFNLNLKNKKQYDTYKNTFAEKYLNVLSLTPQPWKNYAHYLLKQLKSFKANKKCPQKTELKKICNSFIKGKIGDSNEFFPNYVEPFSLIDEEILKSLKNLKIIHMRGWYVAPDYDLLKTLCDCCPNLKFLYISRNPMWTKEECVLLMEGFKTGNISKVIQGFNNVQFLLYIEDTYKQGRLKSV